MEPLSILRAAALSLLRRPGYTLLVVSTLALGIGGTTAVYTLLDGVLLSALPYAEPDRLVTVEPQNVHTGFFHSLSIPDYRDWRDRNRVFDRFGGSAGTGYVRTTPEGAELLDGRMVLGDLFELLGLEAEVGRTFTAEETRAGAAPVAVLGHAFWQRAFGGDPSVVGRALPLGPKTFTVVGVLRAGAGYPRPDVDVYTPMGVRAETLPWDDRNSSFGTRALARLAPGATLAEATADMRRVTNEVDELGGRPHVRARVRTVDDLLLGDVSRALWVLMGAVGVVLLIAGANVANLSLARGEARADELALRRALGADHGRIVRLLLAESLWLALLGGATGVALAAALVGALPSVLPVEIPALVAGRIGVHGPVLAFATAVSLACGVVFGLLPALGAARSPSAGVGARTTTGRGSRRFRDGLIVAQVGLSVVLLVGAGLLLRSLAALGSVEKGFEAQDVLTARLYTPSGTWEGREDWLAFHDEVLTALAGSPEVEDAAATLLLPLTGSSWERLVTSDVGPEAMDERPSFLFNVVSEDYFSVLGIPVLRGRAFEPSDDAGATLVTVIDETMAERFWPGEDPIGRRISFETTGPDEGEEPVWRTVVGVAPNLRHYELASPSRPQAYVPMRQAGRASGVTLRVAARVRGDAAPAAGLLRRTVARLRPGIPVSEVRMLDDYVSDELGSSRALGAVTAAFGVIAALLAALGIFGVLTLTVARRTREIGVRMAVGAAPAAVVSMVLRRGMGLTLLGGTLGLAAAAGVGRVLETFLYEVRPWDPGVYAAASALLALAALVAVTHPAVRAARTSPSAVLRAE